MFEPQRVFASAEMGTGLLVIGNKKCAMFVDLTGLEMPQPSVQLLGMFMTPATTAGNAWSNLYFYNHRLVIANEVANVVEEWDLTQFKSPFMVKSYALHALGPNGSGTNLELGPSPAAFACNPTNKVLYFPLNGTSTGKFLLAYRLEDFFR